uniref:Uncharacterized protein n=1 Tax=Lotharella oceanica TaxID=641309 RepID=A0A7S2XIT9_9EUKA|mmetsp:Transcript_4878/g.9695  ORF Transcript_4878/g.9695 Transcript_4878/m.9695 type:complete len:291 (+) Transcript_4878:47-919(+)
MECIVDHLRDQTDPLFLRGDERERTRQCLDAFSVFFRAFATTTFFIFLVIPALVYVDKKFNQYFFNDTEVPGSQRYWLAPRPRRGTSSELWPSTFTNGLMGEKNGGALSTGPFTGVREVLKRLNVARKERRFWKQIRDDVDRVRQLLASPEISPLVAQAILSIVAILLQKALAQCFRPPRGPYLEDNPGPGSGPSPFDDDDSFYDMSARSRTSSGKRNSGVAGEDTSTKKGMDFDETSFEALESDVTDGGGKLDASRATQIRDGDLVAGGQTELADDLDDLDDDLGRQTR